MASVKVLKDCILEDTETSRIDGKMVGLCSRTKVKENH